MQKLIIAITLFLTLACGTATKTNRTTPKIFKNHFLDTRDNSKYGIVEIGNQKWFAENLSYETPKSLCYKRKAKNCEQFGRLYPSDELGIACPKGWRVPNVDDWNALKTTFAPDSIYAHLEKATWVAPEKHTNQSGLSLKGTGYQLKKRLFLGARRATSLWLNQMNKYDEFYHVHIYGGRGSYFEKSNFHTNEVFHAHPIEDLKNRRLSIRCVCNKKE